MGTPAQSGFARPPPPPSGAGGAGRGEFADADGSAPARPPINPAELLLGTKLHPPARRPHLVDRHGLIDRLRGRSLPQLTLIDAPAGWGKTTLLAEWHAAAGDQPFAWLALDRADNDPARFWTYLVASVRTVEPGLGNTCLALLRVPGTSVTDLVLPTLINEFEALRRPVVLVLDDYHHVANTEIHDQVTFLVEHLPSALRLVIATRSDPPLPLARLRARGQLTEIRAQDLRFSAEETACLLNGLYSLGLGDGDVQRLTERTEGWAAGLHLAALSLRGHPDVHGFVDAFAGDERHIVDYLGAEVLGIQTDDVRAFLLRTSILERLTGTLCDAVTGGEGSAGFLEEIERSNLFLVPLDTKREWYRYHQLFGELLRHELQRVAPDLVPVLHRRAAAWHRDHGLVPDAIRHALGAGDPAEAAAMIASHWNDFVNQGRLETVDGWLNALPPRVVTASPRLCLARAGTSLTLGRRGEVDRWLDEALRAAVPNVVVQPDETAVDSEASIYRAVHRYMAGDFSRAAEAASHAVALEQDGSSPWTAMAFAALGRTLYWRGEISEATTALEEAVRRAQPPRNNLSVIGALGYLAAIHADTGDLDRAEEVATAAVRLSEEHGLAEHWVAMIALVARGTVLEARGMFDEAQRSTARAVELARRGAGLVETTYGLIALAAVRHRQGTSAEARSLLREARRNVGRCPDPGLLADKLARGERALGAASRVPEGTAMELVEELSERELAVLRLLPGRLSRREIGAALHVSPNTVKTHARAIYRKLSASTRAEAVARAREAGLL